MRSARARPLKPGVTTRCNDSGEDVRTWGGWFIVLGPERVAWWDCVLVRCSHIEGKLTTAESLSSWVNYHGAVCLYCLLYWRGFENCGRFIVLGELSWGCMLVLFIVLKGIWELRKVYCSVRFMTELCAYTVQLYWRGFLKLLKVDRSGCCVIDLCACLLHCIEVDLRTAEGLSFCVAWWGWGRMLVLHTRVQKGLSEIRCPGYTRQQLRRSEWSERALRCCWIHL